MITQDESDKWWAEFGPCSPAEWNFDAVPDSDLIACCLWEYARESKTIKLLADVGWCLTRHIYHREAYQRDPSMLERHNEDQKRIEGWARGAGFNYGAFMTKFWKTDFPLLGIYEAVTEWVRDGASAWQHLPAGLRTHLTGKAMESSLLRPLGMAWVGELEELWNANSSDLLEVRSRVRDENDDCEDCALLTETEPVAPRSERPDRKAGKLTAAFTIDFSRFTDNEITEAFRAWLKAQRPKKWKRPRRVLPGSRQRGRKLIEYRVALERLGLMRLLHWHNPEGLREDLPEAWGRIGKKERDFRREVRESAKFFRSLFPFLPKGERPESEERYGVWMPEMQKIADKVEREMGLAGGKK